MTLEFDPNNPAKQKNRPVWATYIPGRRSGPKFKQHIDRGKALNALSMGGGILYHWENVHRNNNVFTEWVEVARVEGDPDSCERCGGNFEVEGYTAGKVYTSIHGVWIGKPKLRYVTVCRECEYAILFPLKKEVPFEDADKWWAKYNRSSKRKVDDRSLSS